MIVGITGDTHNNLKNIHEICTIFNKNSADLVLHTGDISLPKSLLAFKSLNCRLIAVLGNNDIQEKKDLEKASEEFNCEIYEEPYSFEMYNKSISLVHHPDLIDEEMTLTHDLIFHGHTHRYRLERKENCLIFNPGECAGFMKGKNQIGLVNLEYMEPKIINF